MSVGAAVLVVAGAAGTAVVIGSQGGGDRNGGTSGVVETDTSAVRRGDLVEAASSAGSLQYGEHRQVGTAIAGTVTWLPAAGSVVDEGERLYEVDRTSAVKLDGRVPAWRELAPGVSQGQDVRQLEQALADLGYPSSYDLEIDGEWTFGTTAAVEEWQEDRGLEKTGVLPLGTIVFAEDDLRIGSTLVDVGSTVQPGTPILDASAVRREIEVELEPSRRNLATIGAEVDLQFADGVSARGRVTAIEVVPAADEQSDEMLAVTVEPSGRSSVRSVSDQLDGAAVLVAFADVVAQDVLIVPINALVALSEGGYAVEVVEGNESRLVEVSTEAFAGTEVAVDGGIGEGERVVVTP